MRLRETYLEVKRGETGRIPPEAWQAFCANPIKWLARARDLEERPKIVDGLWISGMAERLTHGGWLLSLRGMVYEVRRPIHVHVAGGGDDWLEPGMPSELWFEVLPVIRNGHRPRRAIISLGDAFAERADEHGYMIFDFGAFLLHRG